MTGAPSLPPWTLHHCPAVPVTRGWPPGAEGQSRDQGGLCQRVLSHSEVPSLLCHLAGQGLGIVQSPQELPVPLHCQALLLSRSLHGWRSRGRELMLRPGLGTSARITGMGCAPPTAPLAGQGSRLGLDTLEKQAGGAPSPAFLGAAPVRARSHGWGAGMAQQSRDESCPQLSPGHSQLFVSPAWHHESAKRRG